MTVDNTHLDDKENMEEESSQKETSTSKELTTTKKEDNAKDVEDDAVETTNGSGEDEEIVPVVEGANNANHHQALLEASTPTNDGDNLEDDAVEAEEGTPVDPDYGNTHPWALKEEMTHLGSPVTTSTEQFHQDLAHRVKGPENNMDQVVPLLTFEPTKDFLLAA